MSKHEHYHVEDFRGSDCVGYLMSHAYASMRSQVEALFEHEDLNFTQWRVLMCLIDERGNTSADVSRELSHDKGSMTRIIDELERRRFIKRQRDKEDRRVVFLALTPAGRAAATRLVPKIVAYYNALLADFSPEDVRRLTQLLVRLKGTLQSGETAGREAHVS